MEPKRSWTALVGHSSIFVDQINSIGPTGIGLLRAIVEIVNQRRKFNSQLPHAHPCHVLALGNVFRTGEDDFIPNVALHLPHVTRMRFEDVHGVELHTRSVFVVKLVESGNLPPKWRSSIAAKDKHYRLPGLERREAYMRRFIQSGQTEIGSGI